MNRGTLSFDLLIQAPGGAAKQGKIMISRQPTAVFTTRPTLRWLFAFGLLAAIAAPGTAEAARARRAAATGGGFDGHWNVLIITQAGPCEQAYNFPFQISGGRISSS